MDTNPYQVAVSQVKNVGGALGLSEGIVGFLTNPSES